MKIGLFYLFSEFGNVPQDRIFGEVLEEIDYGEELGFDSVWLPEHHFSVYGTLGNPMTFASAIAQRTKRMLIGTAVMVLPFQHPLRIAEDAALVDALSGGRLLLGVGRGYRPGPRRAVGVAGRLRDGPGLAVHLGREVEERQGPRHLELAAPLGVEGRALGERPRRAGGELEAA